MPRRCEINGRETECYTTKETAAVLGISIGRVWQLKEAGELHSLSIGKSPKSRKFYEVADVEALKKRRNDPNSLLVLQMDGIR